MKFYRRFLSTLALIALVFTAGLLVRESVQTVQCAISNNNPLPATWIGSGGTNAFTLSASAVPIITKLGTNWTAMTTNKVFLRDTAVSNTFRFVNGILVDIY